MFGLRTTIIMEPCARAAGTHARRTYQTPPSRQRECRELQSATRKRQRTGAVQDACVCWMLFGPGEAFGVRQSSGAVLWFRSLRVVTRAGAMPPASGQCPVFGSCSKNRTHPAARKDQCLERLSGTSIAPLTVVL